ncbi:hypothetical protein [Corallococcus silvisoli]|uniref:hypothetical protein n=1 Tax=Corallococcus silvisoli TaxID=2697031 RepID=UPI00137864C0|nr:hypothetical protein [Corallococcus silvisoli]NBD12034.1 hypothetical protein [Corallococcus silvisoli]
MATTWLRREEKSTRWRVMPFLTPLLLLGAALLFAPFPQALRGYQGSPLVSVTGVALVISGVAIRSRSLQAARLLSALSLILAVPVFLFFHSETAQLRGLYRLHAVATEACQSAREDPSLSSEAVFEKAARLAGLDPKRSSHLGLRCEDPGSRTYTTDGFDPRWGLSADGVLH